MKISESLMILILISPPETFRILIVTRYSKSEPRRDLEAPRSSAIWKHAIAKRRGEGRYVRHWHCCAYRCCRRRWANIDGRAVVLIEIRAIEEIESFTQELQHITVLDVELA